MAALLFVSVVGGPRAYAQAPQDIERAQREAQRILQEEQQREQIRRRELEERMRTPRGETLTPKAPQKPAAPSERCVNIERVELEGATALSDADRQNLLRAYLGRCVGLAEINQLLQDITNHYIARGYTTTRAYIPEQDMSSGVLRILVLEGIVEKIMLKGEGVSLATAFPGLEGKLFNLREFEQGLDQINRLRSNNATIDIAPGSAPGTSIIEVSNSPGKRWWLTLANDNTGSKSTGRHQTSLTLGLDDPLGLNDYLNLSLRINPDAGGDKLSRAIAAYYAVPYGPWTFSFNATDFEYRSIVHGQFFDFDTSGTSRTQALRVERNMYRDQRTKFSLSAGLTLKDNKNYINDELIEAGSRRLTIADIGANLSLNALGAFWSFDLGYGRGLKSFGALEDPDGWPADAPQAQFERFTYGLSFSMPMQAGETQLVWQSMFSGQYSPDVLHGTEQISIGSPFTVRGYRKSSIAGDTGWFWRNEIGVPLQLSVLGEGLPPGRIRPFLGYDVGHINARGESPGGTLTGFTAGVDLYTGPFSIQIAYSIADRMPSNFNSNEKSFYFRIAMDL